MAGRRGCCLFDFVLLIDVGGGSVAFPVWFGYYVVGWRFVRQWVIIRCKEILLLYYN